MGVVMMRWRISRSASYILFALRTSAETQVCVVVSPDREVGALTCVISRTTGGGGTVLPGASPSHKK